jgi:hypothetical protein
VSRQTAIAQNLSGMPHLTIINDEPLSAHHLMRTEAHFGSDGHLTAVTRTRSVVLRGGFHGAVPAHVYDADGGEDTHLLGDALDLDVEAYIFQSYRDDQIYYLRPEADGSLVWGNRRYCGEGPSSYVELSLSADGTVHARATHG